MFFTKINSKDAERFIGKPFQCSDTISDGAFRYPWTTWNNQTKKFNNTNTKILKEVTEKGTFVMEDEGGGEWKYIRSSI